MSVSDSGQQAELILLQTITARRGFRIVANIDLKEMKIISREEQADLNFDRKPYQVKSLSNEKILALVRHLLAGEQG